jgi:hypothetical protein
MIITGSMGRFRMARKGRTNQVGQRPAAGDDQSFAGSGVEGEKDVTTDAHPSEIIRGEDVLKRLKRGG